MTLPAIFCPQCDTLILLAEQCPTCQWRRPAAIGEIGQIMGAVALQAKLPRHSVRPVARDTLVYLPTAHSEIVALDTAVAGLEEAIKWRYQFDPRYQGYSLAVWQEYLLLGNEYIGRFPTPQGELIVLSAKSGEEIWRLPVEGASLSVPVVQEGIAYFTVNTGWLYAVELATQRELWRRKVPAPWFWSPAAPLLTPTGLFVLPSRSEQLLAYRVEPEETVWTFPAGGWFPHTPVWVDGIVYARCWDRHIYAVEGATGRELWRYKAPRDYSSDIWLNEQFLYVGVKDYVEAAESGPRAYALYTLDRHTGQRVGRFEVKGHIEARPVATEAAVFFATDDRDRDLESQGTLYALDSQGRQLLWEPQVVEQRFQSDLLLVDDVIIAGTRQGAIYALRWQTVDAIETPQVYLERGAWEEAAIAYVQQGQYLQAAEIYARELGQPLRAGRLYLHAGHPRRVLELLGSSKGEAERALAVEAAQAMPTPQQRATALQALGEHLAAAKVYLESEDWLAAGACFEAAQTWAEARAVYVQAAAWDKWEKLTRELQLWDELVERLLQVGDYARAAEVYLGRGLFAKAADYYDRAGRPIEALAAYRQVKLDLLPQETQQRLAELAETQGDVDTAIAAYLNLRQAAKAAALAEAAGRYEQALTLYGEAGEEFKAALLLEKLARYAEAAALFERVNRPGRAAENWERQVEQAIKRAGEVRYVRKNQQIESQLSRAITLFEEAANLAEETDRIDDFNKSVDRCRLKLKQIRGEPLLSWSVQADGVLVVDEGNNLRYSVENVGWGPAEALTLSIGGNFLHNAETDEVGTLKRKQKKEGLITVVPKIRGKVTLRVELRGHSAFGPLRETVTQPIIVTRPGKIKARAEDTLNIQRTVTHGVGQVWDEGSDSSPGESEVVSPDHLKQLRVESLRRQLGQHYANLNKLEEQAAGFGAGQAPLYLQNQIEIEQNTITTIETELHQLTG